jgi:hypothetical protein
MTLKTWTDRVLFLDLGMILLHHAFVSAAKHATRVIMVFA